MKRIFPIFLSVIMLLSLTACQQKTNKPIQTESEFKKTEKFGNVPADFEKIVSENLFHDALAFGDRYLKQVRSDGESLITMYDIYGNILAKHSRKTDKSHTVSTVTATDDGGFIYVLGFYDYALSDGTWASENGVVSTLVKCDKDGNTEWETNFENFEGGALEYCLCVDGNYYLFGALQTPETNQTGVYSYTDIVFCSVNGEGKITKSEKLGGSDYDYLQSAYYDGNSFVLYACSQSNDGDFADESNFNISRNWKITLDSELHIISKEIVSASDYSYTVGYNGQTSILRNNGAFADIDYGTMTSVSDYGDFYLTVWENRTGIYENTPQYISSIWYYTETVYAAVNKDGNVLWVTSADSSPDYDKWIEDLK